jgi:plasmid stabilization system protein ParE
VDYKVDFKDSFLEDLERIVRGIAEENAPAARGLGEAILRATESLEFFPERHPHVRQRPKLRRLVVGKYYKVFCRVARLSKFRTPGAAQSD